MQRRNFLAISSAATLAGLTPWTGAQAGPGTLRGYVRTNWSRDPYTLGAYSYIARVATRGDRQALEAPIGEQVFFAGEATLAEQSSTVHAAHMSGLRAAKRVRRTGVRKIAVVGAGMAGLTVAHQLSREGLEVTVIEARDRIGGRLWTDRRLGLPLDLGASWIHGTRGNPLAKLARQAGMSGTDTNDSYILRGGDGRKMGRLEYPGWLQNVAEVQHSAGADTSELNLSAYDAEDGFAGPDRKFQGGYSDILKPLAGDYEIRLGQSVRRIEHGAGGVSLNGEAFDAVVVTVPLGVLKAGHIQFDPGLPDAKRRAIARLGMGLLDKVYLLYDHAFWDDETWILTPENGLPRGQFNQWLNFDRYWGVPLILAFNGAGPARDLAKLSDTEVIRRAQHTLARAYPG